MNEQLVRSTFGPNISVNQADLPSKLLTVLIAWGADSFNPRNTVNGVKQYYSNVDEVAEAIYTAWNHLVREDFLVPNHQSASPDWFVLSSRAKSPESIARLSRLGKNGDDRSVPANSLVSESDESASERGRRRTVMVVYGRDANLKEAIFRFLEAVGLTPVEWEEGVKQTGIATPYTGQVLDAIFNSARAVIVLLSGDDEAKLREQFLIPIDGETERSLTPQARPNVIFEAGMAFGRRPNQTIIVEIGLLRPFTDIVGRNVVRFDGTQRSREQLVNRLATAGSQLALDGRHLSMDLGYNFSPKAYDAVGGNFPGGPSGSDSTRKILKQELTENAKKLRRKAGLGNTIGPFFSPTGYDPGTDFLSAARWDAFKTTSVAGLFDPEEVGLMADAFSQIQIMAGLEEHFRKIKAGPVGPLTQAGYDLRNSAGPALAAIEQALAAFKD